MPAAASTLAPTPARGGTPTLTPTTARTSANTNTQPNSSGSSASAHGASGSGSDSSSALEQEGGASSAWPVTALQYWRERQTALFVGLAGLLLLCGLLYRYGVLRPRLLLATALCGSCVPRSSNKLQTLIAARQRNIDSSV